MLALDAVPNLSEIRIFYRGIIGRKVSKSGGEDRLIKHKWLVHIITVAIVLCFKDYIPKTFFDWLNWYVGRDFFHPPFWIITFGTLLLLYVVGLVGGMICSWKTIDKGKGEQKSNSDPQDLSE